MNKILIKVIKRNDTRDPATAKTQSAGEANPTAPGSEEKIERHTRREIVATISNWISERRKNNRIEELIAIGKFFNNEPLSEI